MNILTLNPQGLFFDYPETKELYNTNPIVQMTIYRLCSCWNTKDLIQLQMETLKSLDKYQRLVHELQEKLV